MSQILQFNNNFVKRLLNWKNKQSNSNWGDSENTDDVSNSTNKFEGLDHNIRDHFRRSTKNRMSMPLINNNHQGLIRTNRPKYVQLPRPSSTTQRHSLGHIYLQCGGETKQVTLPNELTAIDTIRALFVCAFPNVLSMNYMSQSHVKIYIYNPNCNIFYELVNIGDVEHESVLRLHLCEPEMALGQQQVISVQQQYPKQTVHQVDSEYMRQVYRQVPPFLIPPPKPRRMMQWPGVL